MTSGTTAGTTWHTGEVSSIERRAPEAAGALHGTVRRLRTLTTGFIAVAALIGLATWLTGWWVFNRHRGMWATVGVLLCAAPTLAALGARAIVGAGLKRAGSLVGEVGRVLRDSRDDAQVLIDHDSGKPIATSAKSLRDLRHTIASRKAELPALATTLRAVTATPGLLAIGVLGSLGLGALGTILLIVGLAR